tara:strand:+ start:3660 stop:4235 length:576 start_codon:yes stop_codon:yes gene_type:complete
MEIQELHKYLAKEALNACRFGSRLDYWQIKEGDTDAMLVSPIGGQAIVPAVELNNLPEDREYLPGRMVRFNLGKYSYTCPQSSTQGGHNWVILSPLLPARYIGRGPNIHCPQLADYNDKLIEAYGTKVFYPDSQLWPLELGVIYRYDAGVPIGAYELRKILKHLPDRILKRVSNAVASENDERFYENTLIK